MLSYSGLMTTQDTLTNSHDYQINKVFQYSCGGDHTHQLTAKEGSHTAILFKTFFQYKGESKNMLDSFLKDYTKSADTAINAIAGQFLLLIFNQQQNTLTIYSDKLGSIPCYYCLDAKGNFHFSSHLKTVIDGLSTKPSIDNQAIYNYVYHHCIPAPKTIYQNIFKMQCGEKLTVNASTLQNETYYCPNFNSGAVDEKTLQKQLLDTLESSVSDRLAAANTDEVGAFLSGGLDSSTVAGMFAKHSPKGQAKTFTMGFHAEGYDESGFAKITSDHFGTDHHVYYVTPEDVTDSLPAIATYYDEPFGNSSALPAYHCAKFAKEHGVNIMLAGDGGDELFSGNERYAKQKIFELYFKIPAPIRKLLLEIPLSKVNENSNIPIINKVASYVRQATLGLPDRLQSYNFLHRISPETVFTKDFLVSVDANYPLNQIRSRYNLPDKADYQNRMLYLDWKFTLADNDLVKVSNMCHKAGVEVLYPMLDDRLLEMATIIPSAIKLPGNKLRNFYKETTRGFLPDATLNKSKKGFGLPFGVWMKEHQPLREMAYDNVLSLSDKGYFSRPFLEQAIKMHREGHASYYGELIWILSMLNMWLEAH